MLQLVYYLKRRLIGLEIGDGNGNKNYVQLSGTNSSGGGGGGGVGGVIRRHHRPLAVVELVRNSNCDLQFLRVWYRERGV